MDFAPSVSVCSLGKATVTYAAQLHIYKVVVTLFYILEYKRACEVLS